MNDQKSCFFVSRQTINHLNVPKSEEVIEICSFPAGGKVEVPEDLVHLAFEVDDLDQMIIRFREKGVLITDGPTVTSSGARLCFIEAPDKYEVELIERPGKSVPI